MICTNKNPKKNWMLCFFHFNFDVGIFKICYRRSLHVLGEGRKPSIQICRPETKHTKIVSWLQESNLMLHARASWKMNNYAILNRHNRMYHSLNYWYNKSDSSFVVPCWINETNKTINYSNLSSKRLLPELYSTLLLLSNFWPLCRLF